MDGVHVAVDKATMKTSVAGVFAAGDCTGKPYQIAKAVGDREHRRAQRRAVYRGKEPGEKGMNESEIKYLELLSKSFPSIPATAAEIVRLQAILELPKTTEHFMSDIHGEYTYFSHILKNASRRDHDKINDSFGDLLGEEEKNSLARCSITPSGSLPPQRTPIPGTV